MILCVLKIFSNYHLCLSQFYVPQLGNQSSHISHCYTWPPHAFHIRPHWTLMQCLANLPFSCLSAPPTWLPVPGRFLSTFSKIQIPTVLKHSFFQSFPRMRQDPLTVRTSILFYLSHFGGNDSFLPGIFVISGHASEDKWLVRGRFKSQEKVTQYHAHKSCFTKVTEWMNKWSKWMFGLVF